MKRVTLTRQKLEEREGHPLLIMHKQHFLAYTIKKGKLSHQNWHQSALLHANANANALKQDDSDR